MSASIACDLCDSAPATVICDECAADGFKHTCADDDATMHSDAKRKKHVRRPIHSEATATAATTEAAAAAPDAAESTTAAVTPAASPPSAAISESALPPRSTSASLSVSRRSSGDELASTKLSTPPPSTQRRSLLLSAPPVLPACGSNGRLRLCHLCSVSPCTVYCDTCKRDSSIASSEYCASCERDFHVAQGLDHHFRQPLSEALGKIKQERDLAAAMAGSVPLPEEDESLHEEDQSRSAAIARRKASAAATKPAAATASATSAHAAIDIKGTAEEQAAALRIQAIYRGVSIRKQQSAMRRPASNLSSLGILATPPPAAASSTATATSAPPAISRRSSIQQQSTKLASLASSGRVSPVQGASAGPPLPPPTALQLISALPSQQERDAAVKIQSVFRGTAVRRGASIEMSAIQARALLAKGPATTTGSAAARHPSLPVSFSVAHGGATPRSSSVASAAPVAPAGSPLASPAGTHSLLKASTFTSAPSTPTVHAKTLKAASTPGATGNAKPVASANVTAAASKPPAASSTSTAATTDAAAPNATKSATASTASSRAPSPKLAPTSIAASTGPAPSPPMQKASSAPSASPPAKQLSVVTAASASASWTVPPLSLPLQSPPSAPPAAATGLQTGRSVSRASSRAGSRHTSPVGSPLPSGGRTLGTSPNVRIIGTVPASASASSSSSSGGGSSGPAVTDTSLALFLAKLEVLESRLLKDSKALNAERLVFENEKFERERALVRELEEARAKIARETAEAKRIVDAAEIAARESRAAQEDAFKELVRQASQAHAEAEKSWAAGESQRREALMAEIKTAAAAELRAHLEAEAARTVAAEREMRRKQRAIHLAQQAQTVALVEAERERIREEELHRLLGAVPPRAARLLRARMAMIDQNIKTLDASIGPRGGGSSGAEQSSVSLPGSPMAAARRPASASATPRDTSATLFAASAGAASGSFGSNGGSSLRWPVGGLAASMGLSSSAVAAAHSPSHAHSGGAYALPHVSQPRSYFESFLHASPSPPTAIKHAHPQHHSSPSRSSVASASVSSRGFGSSSNSSLHAAHPAHARSPSLQSSSASHGVSSSSKHRPKSSQSGSFSAAVSSAVSGPAHDDSSGGGLHAELEEVGFLIHPVREHSQPTPRSSSFDSAAPHAASAPARGGRGAKQQARVAGAAQ